MNPVFFNFRTNNTFNFSFEYFFLNIRLSYDNWLKKIKGIEKGAHGIKGDQHTKLSKQWKDYRGQDKLAASYEQVELKEGRMKELHTLIQQGKSAEEIAKKAIKIASEICVFTNNNISVEKI